MKNKDKNVFLAGSDLFLEFFYLSFLSQEWYIITSLLPDEVPRVVKNSGNLFNITLPEQWLHKSVSFTGFGSFLVCICRIFVSHLGIHQAIIWKPIHLPYFIQKKMEQRTEYLMATTLFAAYCEVTA